MQTISASSASVAQRRAPKERLARSSRIVDAFHDRVGRNQAYRAIILSSFYSRSVQRRPPHEGATSPLFEHLPHDPSRRRDAGRRAPVRPTCIDANRPLPYKPRNFFRQRDPRDLSAIGCQRLRRLRERLSTKSGDETREADLSAEQAGAEAPTRFPRPYGDQRRPQGHQCSPRAGPQAAQRVTAPMPAGPRFHGAVEAAVGLSCRRRRGEGPGDGFHSAGA